MLIALGLLGIASWLRQRQPKAAGPLAQLESVGGWIGLVGLIWGLFMLIRWISAIGALAAAPVMMIIALASAVSITALSLILAMPTVKTLAGSNDFTRKLEQSAAKLGPFKVVLGAVCLGLAVVSLVL
ncbi:MAG: hypothetical protein AB7E72_16925 [Lysobacterales bacterium]